MWILYNKLANGNPMGYDENAKMQNYFTHQLQKNTIICVLARGKKIETGTTSNKRRLYVP